MSKTSCFIVFSIHFRRNLQGEQTMISKKTNNGTTIRILKYLTLYAWITPLYYMKYSCIPNGSKVRKMISPLSQVAIPFLSTRMWYHFWTNLLLAFSRGFQWSARGALSRLLFLTRAKNFKKLFIPIVNVVKWKNNTEIPSRFVDVIDGELTQFLEKI